MMDQLRRRRYGTTILACVFCLLIGTGLAMVIGRTQPQPFWIIFGGNTDPNDDDGAGARQQLIAGGWTTPETSVQVRWAADIGQGTARITDEAMAAGRAAYDEHCSGGRPCIIAGFSLGNSPALQLAADVDLAPENTYLFGAPQPAPGLFHSAAIDNPIAEGWFDTFSALKSDRPVAAGVQNFFHTGDPYANAAPQCNGPGLFALGLDRHIIISRAQADEFVWTGPDGVVNHEAGKVPPPGLPASGADPSAPWAFCPPGGWYSPSVTPVGPGPVPAVPGEPNPGGAAEGELPGGAPSGVPNVPGVPGAPDNGGGGIPTAVPTQLPGLPGVGG